MLRRGDPRLPVAQTHVHGLSLSMRASEQPGTLFTLGGGADEGGGEGDGEGCGEGEGEGIGEGEGEGERE